MGKESEPSFYNVTVTTFSIPIVFRSMWGSCEVSNSVVEEGGCEFKVLTSIVRIYLYDGKFKEFFDKSFKTSEGREGVRFGFERIKPNVFCKVINKDDIVLEVIMGVNWGGPYIREN